MLKSKIVIFLFFFLSMAHAGDGPTDRPITYDLDKTIKKFSSCQFKQTVNLEKIFKSKITPALRMKNAPSKPEKGEYFRMTKGAIGIGMYMFPPLLLAVPFSALADILATPYYAIDDVVKRIQHSKKVGKGVEGANKKIEAFKREFEKLEPNPIKRKIIINQLYVYSLISDTHQWLLEKKRDQAMNGREKKYYSLFPQIGKNLKMEIKMREGDWDIETKEVGWQPLDDYFKIRDFPYILDKYPNLCDSPGLESVDQITSEYSKIILDNLAYGEEWRKNRNR